jgi:hypothetical protein
MNKSLVPEWPTFTDVYSFTVSYSPSFQLLYTVKEKGEKPDIKPYTVPYGLRNPFRNLKSEDSPDYAGKPQ